MPNNPTDADIAEPTAAKTVNRLDPDVVGLLEQFARAGRPPLNTLTPYEARANARALVELRGDPVPVAAVENTSFPGPAGEISIRVYRPPGEGPFPLLVYYHGGGWVVCDLDTHDNACRTLCAGAQCVTVSVDYRLAPEHKFPAAFDDSYAAVEWAAANAAGLGADAERLAVGGDSAGGNLAAAAALAARHRRGPPIRRQLLIYPITTVASLDTPSYTEFAKGYFLEKAGMEWFRDHYLTGPGDAADPRVSPLEVEDVSDLPAAQIITAGFDPLRDEGAAYARRLEQAGVAVDYTCYADTIHGFANMTGALPGAKKALTEIAEQLSRALGARE